MSRNKHLATGRWMIAMRVRSHFGSLPAVITGSHHRERSLSRARAFCRLMNVGRTWSDVLYYVRHSDRRSGV
jgi:hypothetical protein